MSAAGVGGAVVALPGAAACAGGVLMGRAPRHIVIAFVTEAHHLAPRARMAFEAAVVQVAAAPATIVELGVDAIGVAIELFKRSETQERVLIVLTDGNDTGSMVPPVRAAESSALPAHEPPAIGLRVRRQYWQIRPRDV